MTAVLLSTDLMFSSKLVGSCKAHGWPLAVVGTVDDAIAQAQHAQLLLIDLSLPSLAIGELVANCRNLASPPRAIVTFGPHVHASKLQAAEAAGCDRVYSRGQFNAHVDQVLGEFLVSLSD